MKECLKCKREHEQKGNFCSRVCANSRSWSDEDKLRKSLKLKGRKVEVKQKLEKTCVVCESLFLVTNCKKDKNYCSRKCYKGDKNFLGRKKISGGYRKGSGRGKSGWYKSYWCDSSYELAYVVFNLDHNISFERNKQGYEYVYEGKKLKYYPDFICEGELVEIKGYNSKQFEAKLHAVEVKILWKEDLKEIFNYVENKYGKDFIKLYEDKAL